MYILHYVGLEPQRRSAVFSNEAMAMTEGCVGRLAFAVAGYCCLERISLDDEPAYNSDISGSNCK